MPRQAKRTRLTTACIFLPLRVSDSSSAVMYHSHTARMAEHEKPITYARQYTFTEEVSRHFVCENPPPPPAKSLTRNELRLLEPGRLCWSERQPIPQQPSEQLVRVRGPGFVAGMILRDGRVVDARQSGSVIFLVRPRTKRCRSFMNAI